MRSSPPCSSFETGGLGSWPWVFSPIFEPPTCARLIRRNGGEGPLEGPHTMQRSPMKAKPRTLAYDEGIHRTPEAIFRYTSNTHRYAAPSARRSHGVSRMRDRSRPLNTSATLNRAWARISRSSLTASVLVVSCSAPTFRRGTARMRCGHTEGLSSRMSGSSPPPSCGRDRPRGSSRLSGSRRNPASTSSHGAEEPG